MRLLDIILCRLSLCIFPYILYSSHEAIDIQGNYVLIILDHVQTFTSLLKDSGEFFLLLSY